MNARLSDRWEALRSSYWFVPALLAAGSSAMGLGVVALDGHLGVEATETLGWIYTGGPEGARGVLSTIAGSMITVAGVTFSVLVVALSLAASQFGPRVLGSFMRDRGNQVVLGSFVGTFLYCLLVLRTVRGGEDADRFVPHLSVTLGVALAVLNVGVLIYFVHHAAVSIQVASVIDALAADLDAGVERLFPGGGGRTAPEPDASVPATPPRHPITHAGGDGYVQALHLHSLAERLRRCGTVVRLDCQPGDFVAGGEALGSVERGGGDLDAAREAVREAFVLGARRTPAQDVRFSVDQLADVAIRALSPGINDPFTAAACVDRLGAALARLAERPSAPRLYRDRENAVRVIVDPPQFAVLMEGAFGPIRRYGEGSSFVLLRLADALVRVARRVRGDDRARVVRSHAAALVAAAERSIADPADRVRVAEQVQLVHEALRGPRAERPPEDE